MAAMSNKPAVPPPPRRLFHWTDAAGLERIAAAAASLQGLAGLRAACAAKYEGSLPRALGAPAAPILFGWIHPVTGMAVNPGEIYAGRGAPRDARMLIVDIRRGLAVAAVVHDAASGRVRASVPAPPGGADLVYHELRHPNGSSLREWIVLRARAVKSLAALPSRELKIFLRGEMEKLGNPSYQYPERLLHGRSARLTRGRRRFFLDVTSLTAARRAVIIPAIERVLRLRPDDVPAAFRHPLIVGPLGIRVSRTASPR